MLDEIKSVSVNNQRGVSFGDFQTVNEQVEPVSLFETSNDVTGSENVEDENLELLNEQLDTIVDEQGCFSKGWNNLKEKVGLGTSVDKCEDYIEQYKKGEITYEEAAEKLAEFDSKQESSLNLFSNIASSVLSIAAVAAAAAITVGSGGLALPAAIAIGAGTGAVTKAGMKTIDRATNEVEGDAGNVKDIAKDALSGAVTGGLATATMGTAGSSTCVKEAVASCAKTGIKTGAISGASNYSIDCAFDEDKDFNFGDFAKNTAVNAAVGCGVGAIMGGANGYLHSSELLNSGCNLETMVSGSNNVIKDVAANSACTAEYKVLIDRVKSFAA